MLNNRNCQSIAETASTIIGYSVLLTGNDGVVLGSSDPKRVGTLHEASLEVIRSGCQAYHDEQQAKAYQGTRPGTTIPIIINDEVVGSIGITGQPVEISKYGILIRKLAEVFIKDQLEMESARLLDLSRQNLLRELITYDPNIMEEKAVLDHGRVFGYDLMLPRVAVLIEVSPAEETNSKSRDSAGFFLSGSPNNKPLELEYFSIVKQIFNHRQDLCVFLGDNKYIAFVYLGEKYKHRDDSEWITSVNAKCDNLLSQFDKAGLSAWIGIGSSAESLQDFKNSYADANQAVYILKRRMKSGIQYINEVYLEKLILSIPDHICKRFFEEIIEPLAQRKDGEEYISLIIIWCESRFNFTQTAKSLNIHKNTLAYRFHRFREITGFDLYDFNSTIAMYIIITHYKVNNLL